MAEPRQQTRNFGELIARLSSKRQEIIRPVQEHPHEFVLLTVRELAKRLETDTATLLRIVRGMGFSGFRDFKKYLHAVSTMQFSVVSSYDGIPSDRDPAAPIRRSLDQALKNIQGLKNSVDFERLMNLPKRIHSARRVLVFGGDLTISLVAFLQYYFTFLAVPVETGTTPGQSVHLARTADRRDLVLAISFQRGLQQTVEGLRQAHANGAYCIGITDTFVSPIARFSDECFLVPIQAPFGTSYVAPMAFLSALVTACAYSQRHRTLSLMRKADEEQEHGFRWFREETYPKASRDKMSRRGPVGRGAEPQLAEPER